jgi:phosphatidylserine/phosphatidylglycerophosphate/cardiolipin synthase-like enzyme
MHRIKALVPMLALAAACSNATELDPTLLDPPEAADESGPSIVGADGKTDDFGLHLPAYDPLPEDADLDAPFQVLFAPDDPVNTLEITLIQRVVDARAQDPQSYAEGDNPFRIRYAVYNLRNERIVKALADAEDAGVDVQILIEADQLDPARDHNQSDEYLVSRGFELVPNHKYLTASTRKTADLIGITGSGLMHLKTRLFEAPGFSAGLSGSLNPGDQAVANEETLHLIRDPRLLAKYGQAYETVLNGGYFANSWDETEAVNVMFTPAKGLRAVTKLFDWLEAEQEQILLMVFSLRNVTAPGHSDSLEQLLARKRAQGVPVYVITDRKQSDGVDSDGNPLYANDKTEDRLRQAGIPVYEATNRATPFTAMHHKVGILGRSRVRVITDAANWTLAGLGSSTKPARNVESVLFVDSEALDAGRTGRRYLAQWMRVLSRYAEQSAAIDGEAGFAEVHAGLLSSNGWPTEELFFQARAETAWGQQIEVRGDHASLGAWDAGLPLTTGPDSYPLWSSSDTALMPLSTFFEWKLVKVHGTTATWEWGGNRPGFAAPTALSPTSTLTGTWR